MVARAIGISDKSNILWVGGSEELRLLDQSEKERTTIVMMQIRVANVLNILNNNKKNLC